MSSKAVEYAREREDLFRNEFFDLLRIQSISTDSSYKDEVSKAADWLVAGMKRIGIEHVEAIPTAGHPMVCGDWLSAGADKPTVLLYAHYDIQPADPLELWDSPPFEPDIRDGRIYARGVVDDKIGVHACLKAAESFLKTQESLPVNIKFLFEGEEETGSPSVPGFIEDHPERIACDTIAICDGSGPPDYPLITLSCRGIVGAEVRVTGPPQDMHSGSVGGLVENPIHVASRIIGSFHDSAGRVSIPGFYSGATGLTSDEKERYPAIEAGYLDAMKSRLGEFTPWGDPDHTPLERLTVRPTCDVNGIYGGYQGAGMKTIIPSIAGFKVTMRLAPGQDPDHLIDAFTSHVDRFSTDSAKVDTRIEKRAWPATSEPESASVSALERACKTSWGKKPILVRTGGTVPIAGTLQRETGIAPVFLAPGVGGLVHSPNEFMHEAFFITAIELVINFLSELGSSAG
jgi:acetylornithine deacetylase/succinyl-diaminopimelate desuccinylase-like protein